MTSRRSFWSYFIFIMILCSWFPSIPARADLEPDVYTGILEHDLTGMVQLARMFVLKSNDAVTGQPVVHAQLTLFFSDFKSVEYVPVYYSDVIYDASKGGLTLQDHGNTYPVRRFPTVVLKRSGDVLQGPYISPELGKIGNMILRKGWTVFQEDILARPILSNVGGFYQGNCTSTDLSSHQVTGIEVLPTRLTSGDYPIVTASDSTMKFMNYATSEYCNYTTPYTTCDFYQRGHFDSYRDNLLLSMGADGLLCKHDGENILSCGTTLEPTCRFTKAPTQTLGAPPLYDEVPALTARTGPEKDPNLSCDDWNGSFAGILKHRVNGLKQNIHLDITTYIANDAGNTPRCYLMASVSQEFGPHPGGLSMITHLVRDVIIDPASLEQTFISDFSNDAILQLRRTDKNTLQGQWYSRLYGHVGEFSAILNNKPEDGNTADYVPALGGSYYQQGIVLGQIQWSATFWSGSDEGDVISADPSRQLRTIGSLIASVAESSTPISMNTSITAVSYDYFTNSVFFRSGSAMFYGQVYWDHLVLRPVVTQYMKDGIAPGQKIVMLRQ